MERTIGKQKPLNEDAMSRQLPEIPEDLGKHKANYVHVDMRNQAPLIMDQAPLTDDARQVIDFWKREAQLTKLKSVRDMLERDIATLEGSGVGMQNS